MFICTFDVYDLQRRHIMYILIDKETDEASIFYYLTPNLNRKIKIAARKLQRIMNRADKYETENYLLYRATTINKGKRGGKRNRSDGWE